MPVIKFSLNDEQYKKLEKNSQEEGVSIQDYIRNILFNSKTIFTPSEAVDRALNKYKKGDCFTLPELYGDDWKIERGVAGAFGKQFFNYILDKCPGSITYVGMTNYGRHAQYKIL